MLLFRELNEEIEYIKEEKDGKQHLFLKGPFAQAEVGNRNKRMYPLPILEKEVNRFTKEKINERCAFGELNHPAGPNINLDRACILITEMKQDGNNFLGKAKVTTKGLGEIVRGLIEDGAKLGVSTRALGSVKLNARTGLNEVQDDLKLLAVDVVSDPSGPDCWTNAIMENSKWIFNAATGLWESYVDDLQKQMHKMPIKELEENKIRLFETFLDELVKHQ